jgi:hypothetical protein
MKKNDTRETAITSSLAQCVALAMGDEGLEHPSETRKKRESSSARTIL